MSMEAVAIMNYLRVKHGAWAWLAAFLTTTAAAAIISICRLSNRLSPIINIINISHSHSSSQQPAEEVIGQHKDENSKETPCSSSNTCNTTATSSSIFTTTLSCTLEKTASGKFTLYYAHDDNINNSSHDFMDLDDDDDNHIKLTAATMRLASSFSSKQAANEWELATLKIKTMDMGWYRHQDLSLLDGNVVRLWNQIPSAENESVLPTTPIRKFSRNRGLVLQEQTVVEDSPESSDSGSRGGGICKRKRIIG